MGQPASYEITFQTGDSFVRLNIFAPISQHEIRQFAPETIALLRKHQVFHVLSDVRGMPNVSTVADQYQLAYDEFQAMGLDRRSRIAVIIEPDDSSHAFMETVMNNAGFPFRLFISEDEAIEWLNEPAAA